MVLFESVPNLSEGRSASVIDEILHVGLGSTSPSSLLHRTSDPDHHRTVLTLAGDAETLRRAVPALVAAAIERIDLRRHEGVHPRVGAVDVVPIVPLAGASTEDADELARRIGIDLAERFELPVFFYQQSARRPETRRLADLRRGGLLGLERRIAGGLLPDAGPAHLHPTAGATICGVRDVLVAFNVVLASGDMQVARRIARAVRETSGGLPAVQALGLPLRRRGLVQVSMNLLDYRVTSPHDVFAAVSRLADEEGVEVLGSELVGLAPEAAFDPRRLEGLRPLALDGDEIRRLGVEEFLQSSTLEARLRAAGLAAT